MRGAVFWPIAAVLTLAALWARFAGFADVFTPEGVLLKPTDSHYYVRFALLQLSAFPRFVSVDPFVNFPEAARIIYPPVHTWLVSAAIAVAGVERAELGASLVGPAVTLAELLLVAGLLRRVLGGGRALVALLGLALLPVMVESSGVGNADHHVHEPYLALALALLTAEAARSGGRGAALAAGALLGASRLLTTATVLLIPVTAAGLLAVALADRSRREPVGRAALRVGAAAAATLALGALAFGELLSLEYVTLSAFPAALAVACFGLTAGLASLLSKERRLGWALAPAIGSAALLGFELPRAGSHLIGGDPLLALAWESQPLWRHPLWAKELFGVGLLLLPLAFLGAARGLGRARDPALGVVTAWSALLLLAAALQARFSQALAGALVVLIALGLPPLVEELGPRARRVALVLGVLAGAALFPALFPNPRSTEPTDEALVRPTMRWLRENTPAPGDPPTYTVIAHHDLGNLLTLWAERPAVATPLSQAPWHIAGNLRAAAVMAAEDDEEAFRRAAKTGARYLVASPFQKILGHPEAEDAKTLGRRLLEGAGTASSDMPATAHFRLVHDSPEQRLRREKGSWARVFEVVKGATLAGRAPPGAEVIARLELTTNLGAPLRYERRTLADESGAFELTVAYPSFAQAEVAAARPYSLSTGARSVLVQVREPEVRDGARIEVVGLAE